MLKKIQKLLLILCCVLGFSLFMIPNAKAFYPNNLYGDTCISLENCTNVTLENINIQNSYSKTDNYGYKAKIKKAVLHEREKVEVKSIDDYM